MLKLSSTDTAKKELRIFELKIQRLSEKQKIKAKAILEELRKCIADIDVAHDPQYNGYINPHRLSDKRTEINNLRHKLKQFIQINS